MKKQITFKITFEDNGTEALAKIEVPHRDANAAASLTKKIAEAIGTIEERHQPAPHSHVHDHDHDAQHDHTHN